MTEGEVIDVRRRAKESYSARDVERELEKFLAAGPTGFAEARTNTRALRFFAACREDVIRLADECLRLRKLLGERADAP